MRCLYCGDDRLMLSQEYPYPYNRVDMKRRITVQHIDKYECLACNKPTYYEKRHGSDMGLEDRYYEQFYKYGLYIYQYTKGIT